MAEFELLNWISAKATSDCLVRGDWPSFLLFVDICKLAEQKKPPPIALSEVAFVWTQFGNSNSNSAVQDPPFDIFDNNAVWVDTISMILKKWFRMM